MALRCLLVSLVVSLGFEMPTRHDVQSWSLASRNWVTARSSDLSALRLEASNWLAKTDSATQSAIEPTQPETVVTTSNPVEPSNPNDDVVFALIGEEMAQEFTLDEARMLALEDASEAPPVAEAEPVLMAGTGPIEPTDAELMALAFPAPDADSIVGEENDDLAGSLNRDPAPTRLSSAVRLTQEAVQAWAVVVRSVTAEPITTR